MVALKTVFKKKSAAAEPPTEPVEAAPPVVFKSNATPAEVQAIAAKIGPGRVVEIPKGPQQPAESLRKKRHDMYDFLASIGAKDMGIGEANRIKMSIMIDQYAAAANFNLKRELGNALKQNEILRNNPKR